MAVTLYLPEICHVRRAKAYLSRSEFRFASHHYGLLAKNGSEEEMRQALADLATFLDTMPEPRARGRRARDVSRPVDQPTIIKNGMARRDVACAVLARRVLDEEPLTVGEVHTFVGWVDADLKEGTYTDAQMQEALAPHAREFLKSLGLLKLKKQGFLRRCREKVAELSGVTFETVRDAGGKGHLERLATTFQNSADNSEI